jgi:hypothetical protein
MLIKSVGHPDIDRLERSFRTIIIKSFAPELAFFANDVVSWAARPALYEGALRGGGGILIARDEELDAGYAVWAPISCASWNIPSIQASRLGNCLASVFHGGFTCPSLERTHEALFVVKSHIAGDLLDAAGSPYQTLGRQVSSNFVLHLLEGSPLFEQAPVQRAE